MFKSIWKSTVMIALALMISAGAAMASGKMEVMIGDTVDLSANTALISPQFKWNVLKDNRILDTQTSRNFSYKFDDQGEYVINLTATSGSLIENTTINVLAGDKYESIIQPGPGNTGDVVVGSDGQPIGTIGDGGVIIDQNGEAIGKLNDNGDIVTSSGSVISDAKLSVSVPLKINLSTLPVTENDNITVLGDSGKVEFNLSQSYGDVIEYRIDKNIYKDSDGNGVANDDIDNSGDNSYLTGSSWITQYTQGETPKTVAEIILVDKKGSKAKKQVEILFSQANTSGSLKAVLDTLPATDQKDGLAHLYDDPHKVSFYAKKSEGGIIEYRIDRNIFEDSNGDGDPVNDIDNLNDISFKTGDVWETQYKKTDQQIIAQLIVVSSGGKGSRVQKGLVFGEKPTPPAPTLKDIEEAQGIRLTADKQYVVKGDPINFTVKGLSQDIANYTFNWDFDGDGKSDMETEGQNSVTYIYDQPGVFSPVVSITDIKGNSDEKKTEVIVKDTLVTKADFSYEADGNTIKFTDLSTVAYNLTDKNLTYSWSFGDTDQAGLEKQLNQTTAQNPIYTYAYKGKYVVTLTVTDADNVVDSKSAEIEINENLSSVQSEQTTENATDSSAGGSLILKIFKVLLYLILIVIALLIFIVGGFLLFLKVQNHDLTFEELIDLFKVKILTIIGVNEMIEPNNAEMHETEIHVPEASETVHDIHEDVPRAHTNEEPETIYPKHPESVKVETETGPVPDWLKGTEVIEGTTVEDNSHSNSQSPMTNDQPSTGDQSSDSTNQFEESITAETVTDTVPEEVPSEAPAEPVAEEILPVTEESPQEESEQNVSSEEASSEESSDSEEADSGEESTDDGNNASVVSQPAAPAAAQTGIPGAKKRRRRRHKKNRPQNPQGGQQPQQPNQA